MSDGAAGVELLRRRCAQVPEALATLAERLLQGPPLPALLSPLFTTGIGCSEGPARLLAELLLRQGRLARFLPLSSFLAPPWPPAARVLVLFSQGLSPNAQLAFQHQQRHEQFVLVTGLTPSHPRLAALRPDACCLSLPTDDEQGLLVRLLGPAQATLLALALGAGPPPSPEQLRDALEAARARALALGPLPPGGLALLASAGYATLCEGLRWRLLEGLLTPRVQLWDALAVAHGPFQGFHTEEIALIGLEHHPSCAALHDRLASMLRPGHGLLRLTSTLDEPWCLLEHLVQLDALMVATASARGLPLSPWPGQGEDGPLYNLGAPR
jgi:creatinine amidohydrolase